MPFTLGQRWISDTESELGLGTVVAIDIRTVTLLFPAIGENRLYARSNSPITRVMFNPGDTITTHEGWQLAVETVSEAAGLLTYIGTRLDNSEQNVAVREVLLDSKLTFSKPQDRLFAGQIDSMDRFALRFRARKYQSEQFRLPWSGLRGIHASLIPHQLHIAHDVGQRHAPRVLLADEVGLGKTIEAGMIIHQQLLSNKAERVLIIVPETLQHQWLVEMLRRFNLHFSLFDDERCTEASLENDNPFDSEQLVICSLNFVCHSQKRLEQLCGAEWDLLVVDEAHHLAWNAQQPSHEYLAIEQLAHHIPSVLLLTATPEQLGQESHFARLRLLDANRFHDYPTFIAEQQQYQPIANAVNLLLNNSQLDASTLSLLKPMVAEQDISALLKRVNATGEDADTARHQLIKRLMDRHGTSRVLFRNTRQSIKGFPRRVLQQIMLPMPSQYQTAMNVCSLMGSNKTRNERAQDMLYPERIYQQLEGDNATWWNFDPRVKWLLEFLLSHRHEKVLVICAQAATALNLEHVLREREGVRAAVFHEGLSIIERDRAAAYFASQEKGAQVLLCSEIGSEGRNFQFSCHLVLFDLPFNPDLLEQRIGRLDRIGQQRDIQILVPYLENSAQAVLVDWYHQGLDAFEHTCPTGHALYESHYQTLLEYLANPNALAGFDAFICQCRQQHETLKQQLEQGRDRLLELNSNGGEKAQALADTIAQQDNHPNLINFAINLFDIIGINQEDHSDNMLILTPSDHMLVPDFPGLPPDGCTVTFHRELALSREDVQFISWEHPLIRHGLDMLLSGDTGSNAVALLKNKALPVGTLLLEVIYVIEAQAPKYLQLHRFLPPTPIRMLLDAKGNDLAAKVEFESFNRQLNAINRHTASKLVNTVQANIHTILQSGEKRITEQAKTVIDTACHDADQCLTTELTRLQSLQNVNPNIRDDELAALCDNRQQILDHLAQAGWRLDALRLVVVSHQ